MRTGTAILLSLLLAGCSSQPAGTAVPSLAWQPVVATEAVTDDPDDPAIWIHPTDPELSLVLGTNKVAAPNGALVVFDLAGTALQTIDGIDRPNNVDLRGNLAALTERNKSALRFFAIDPKTRQVTGLSSVPVFAGETGDLAAPMGIALYRRASDGALFAIVGRKSGPTEGYLWQYRVVNESSPAPGLELVRKFGKFSGTGEIESIVADDERGYVYYSDEGAGIRKYHADPDHPDAASELALFGTTGYRGDREGLGVAGDVIVSTDQIENGSRYLLYRRDGTPSNPHDHREVLAVIEPGADATDGLEVTATPLGPRFPQGLLVVMNSGPKNFLYYSWHWPQ